MIGLTWMQLAAVFVGLTGFSLLAALVVLGVAWANPATRPAVQASWPLIWRVLQFGGFVTAVVGWFLAMVVLLRGEDAPADPGPVDLPPPVPDSEDERRASREESRRELDEADAARAKPGVTIGEMSRRADEARERAQGSES